MTQNRGFKVYSDYEPENVIMPVRKTKSSAGYDLFVPKNFPRKTLRPYTQALIPTGICAYIKPDEFLALHARSGLALKNRVTLQNGVAVIDSDYFPNHIQLIVLNHSDEYFYIEPGMRIAQAVFQKYFITDDDEATSERTSGFGSTGL